MIAKATRNITSWQDLWLLYRVFFLITVLPLLIKWHTLPALLKRLTPAPGQAYGDADIDEKRRKIVKYTDFILGWGVGVWRLTCLKRSLALYHFLSALGMPVQICFGIRLPKTSGDQAAPGQLEGHAWLQYQDALYLEIDPDMTRTYRETYRYPVHHRQVQFRRVLPTIAL